MNISYFIDQYFIKQPKIRRFVTWLLEGNHDQDIQLLGASLHINSIKEHGYLRSFRMAQKSALLREELPVIINLASLLENGDTFVDIGANIGIYSLTLVRMLHIKPEIRFYAFEANPDTFKRLAVKAPAQGINIFNLALSDKSGVLEFVEGAVSHVFTTIPNTSKYSIPSQKLSVECRRLDEIDIEGDSLILKIDVEGQEKEVIDGADGLFRSNRVKAVYLDGYKDKQIESLLLSYGFNLFDGKTLEPTEGGIFSLLAILDKSKSAPSR